MPSQLNSSESTVLVAINGPYMTNQPKNKFLLEMGGEFIREAKTASCYQLCSVENTAAMTQTKNGGRSIQVELWSLPSESLTKLMSLLPRGLVFGKVLLNDGSTVLGQLAEQSFCESGNNITLYGGWNNYTDCLKDRASDR